MHDGDDSCAATHVRRHVGGARNPEDRVRNPKDVTLLTVKVLMLMVLRCAHALRLASRYSVTALAFVVVVSWVVGARRADATHVTQSSECSALRT